MNRLFRNRLTALLLTLIMVIGMVPVASAATTADLTFEVEYDDEVKLSRSKFVNFLEDETDDDDLAYMEITKITGKLDDFGYFTATDVDGKKAELKTAAKIKTSYYYDDEAYDDYDGKSGEYLLNNLTFVAYDDAKDGTLKIEFAVWNYDDEKCTGTMEIKVIGAEDDKDDFDEDDYDLVYEVEADDEVQIKLSELKSLYKDETKKTLNYAEITAVDADFADYGYFKAYYDGDSFELDTVSELKAPNFYVSANDLDDYGDPDRDFELNKLTFVADEDADDGYFAFTLTMWDEDDSKKFAAEIAIVVGEVDEDDDDDDEDEDDPFEDFDEDDYDLVYEVEADDEVEFKLSGLKSLYKTETKKTLYKAEITAVDADFTDYGYFVAYYDDDDTKLDTAAKLKKPDFYVSVDDLDADGTDDDFELGGLTFVANKKADDGYFALKLTMWDEDEAKKYVADVAVVIGEVDAEDDDTSSGSSSTVTADLTFSVDPKKSVELKRKAFKDLFEEEYDDFAYVTFTKITNLDGNGYFTATDYYEDECDFSKAKDLKKLNFFYSADELKDEDTDYELNKMTFTADKGADGEVVMVEFTMYGDKNNKKSVDGMFIIQIGDVETTTAGSSSSAASGQASIRKSITSNSALQINVNDIDRAFKAQYPSGKVQYVKLMNVPATGALYYDYYNTSGRVQMNATNINTMVFYRDAAGAQTDLGKLTYIPAGSNYCTAIVFVAYGGAGQQVVGSLNISVTTNTVSEVYGVTPKNTSVSFPASAIYNAVQAATGKAMASIKLMELPANTKGSITGNLAVAGNTNTAYTYATGTNSISQLKFNPGYNYTGSVEIPYMAYDAAGNPIAMGSFSLGVVNSVKKFTDITSSTWCYKYITELSDAGVIGGYADGSFKPNATITYGAALKLVTLAAGHGEKAPLAGGHTFSGYLAYAQQMGWVTGNVNLSGNITRLQIAQLAAKAMGLNVTNLSANRPFTDTADVYVQALNAAGIIEGYFANGSYTYKPSNTLTRGQVSAIVWRMRNYNG